MIALHVLVTAVGVALGVLYPFISVILASFGFTPGRDRRSSRRSAPIGFTIAVPAWGHLADVRLGRPRTLQVCAIGAGLAVGLAAAAGARRALIVAVIPPVLDLRVVVAAARRRPDGQRRPRSRLRAGAHRSRASASPPGPSSPAACTTVTGYGLAFVLFAGGRRR